MLRRCWAMQPFLRPTLRRSFGGTCTSCWLLTRAPPGPGSLPVSKMEFLRTKAVLEAELIYESQTVQHRSHFPSCLLAGGAIATSSSRRCYLGRGYCVSYAQTHLMKDAEHQSVLKDQAARLRCYGFTVLYKGLGFRVFSM